MAIVSEKKASAKSKQKSKPKASPTKSKKKAKPKTPPKTKEKPKSKAKTTKEKKEAKPRRTAKPKVRKKPKTKATPKPKAKRKTKAEKVSEKKPKKTRPKRLPLEKPVAGILVNYQRGTVNQRNHYGLIRLEDITTVAQAAPYIGRTAILHFNEQRSILGRVVAVHGRNGVLRVRFRRGLASEAIAKEVKVF